MEPNPFVPGDEYLCSRNFGGIKVMDGTPGKTWVVAGCKFY
jgi:hypothetical protein